MLLKSIYYYKTIRGKQYHKAKIDLRASYVLSLLPLSLYIVVILLNYCETVNCYISTEYYRNINK